MTIIFILSGSSQTSPSDWNNSNNSAQVVGAGGASAKGASTSTGGGGGGAGAYNKISNFNIATPGTTVMNYGVGVGGLAASTFPQNGGDTWFGSVAFPTSGTGVGARGGSSPTGNTVATGGVGGLAANGFPTTSPPARDGGAGANGTSATVGGGGGGAGRPNGVCAAGRAPPGGTAACGTVTGGAARNPRS